MSRSIERFVDAFVRPLLAGGRVVPQPPYATSDREEMARDAGVLAAGELAALRLLRAQALLPQPPVADPTAQDLSMWLGLHNLTFLDHPQVGRVWTTARKWELVERETRALFEYARPVDFADAVARHVAVSALASSLREDPAAAMTPEPARAPSMPVIGSALARVDRDHPAPLRASMRWTSAPHARAVARLWPVALWASPLTPLLDPTLAPPHWAPSTGAAFLRHRGLARAIVFGWARQRDWLAVGSVVAGAALQEMGLFSQRLAAGTAGPGSSPERRAGLRTLSRDGGDVGDVGEGEASPTGTSTAPALRLAASRTEVSALLHVFAALVHLHVVKLLEFDARIEPARDLPTQAFLAMPLLLRTLAPRLGDPFTGVEDVALMRRWSDHLEHLAAIVPGELVLSLVAAIAAPATPTSPTPRPSLESM